MSRSTANRLPSLPLGKRTDVVTWNQYMALRSACRTTLPTRTSTAHRRQFQSRCMICFHRKRPGADQRKGVKPSPSHLCGCFWSGEDGYPALILYGYSPTMERVAAAERIPGKPQVSETDWLSGAQQPARIKSCAESSCHTAHILYLSMLVPKKAVWLPACSTGVQYCSIRLFVARLRHNKRYPGGDYGKGSAMPWEYIEGKARSGGFLVIAQPTEACSEYWDGMPANHFNRRDAAWTYLERWTVPLLSICLAFTDIFILILP